jgi:GDP-mannose 6-dehydrogenase
MDAMKISVFGLGYVGCVTAACLAKNGHDVIGVDISKQKVDFLNQGRPTVLEKDLDEIVRNVVALGKLRATDDPEEAVLNSDLSLICVGTPSKPNGGLNIEHVIKVCEGIGGVLSEKDDFHVVVIRSTVLPGTTEESLIPAIEGSSKKTLSDFGVCVNPEFMREGSGVYDFYHPERIVIGTADEKAGNLVETLYKDINAPVVKTDIKTAEMIKYVDNAFHGLKVVFANEIGNICKKIGIDSYEVMDVFYMDKKLNLSPYYLKPGFAFGGSCIPKDIRALLHKAKKDDLECPVLASIIPSNQRQIERGIELIISQGKKNVGVFGLAFKAGTDDIRESPIVHVIETLIGKGYNVRIYDSNVFLPNVFGANRAYIEEKIPHITSLFSSSLEDVLNNSEVLVISNKNEEFKKIPKLMKGGQILIDFVKLVEPNEIENGKYIGICW